MVSVYDEARRIDLTWREEHPEHMEGWVIWLPGEDAAAGWCRGRPLASRWIPGVLAVCSDGKILKAIGGSQQSGAKEWKELISIREQDA